VAHDSARGAPRCHSLGLLPGLSDIIDFTHLQGRFAHADFGARVGGWGRREVDLT
jgi:hypothetical protein